MVRVLARTSVIWPSASCCMTTRVASQAKRRDVSAGTYVPSWRTDWPGASGSASTGASTWTTTWYRSPGVPGSIPWWSAVSATRASPSACCSAMFGGAGSPNGEQPLFGLGCCDSGQRPDLRVRQLTAGESLSQQRQRSQGPCDAHTLARCAAIEPDAPGKPRGAGAKAVTPAPASVELPDQIKQPRAGCVEMRRQFGDLVT